MKNNLDRAIKNVGESPRFMLAAVLLISGLAIMIAVLIAPYAVGTENYSEAGRTMMSVLPWVAFAEIAAGGFILVRSGRIDK